MRSARSSSRLAAAAVLLFLAPASAVEAFKIEGHVWLADQIAGEILENDGAVVIQGREYPLDPEVAAALEAHRGAFLMGVLGADVYPDMLAGQMTTHPGILEQTGPTVPWQTDDWLQHVLTAALESGDDAAVAFACGYLLHAAMDMWAHTFVNLYAGEVFSIADHPEVAERHVALEAYLAAFHQTLLDRGSGSGPGTDAYSALYAPARFVRETLILNDEVALQYDQSGATFYLSALHDYWRGLASARSLAEDAIDQAGAELARIGPYLDAVAAAKEELDKHETAFRGHLKRLTEGAQDAIDVIVGVVDSIGLLGPLEEAGVEVSLDDAAEAAKQALDAAYAAYEAAVDTLGYGAELALDPDAIRGRFEAALTAFSVEAIDAWQANVEAAMDAWVVAWEETAKELMRPEGSRFTPGSDPAEPLSHWAACWGPVLGLPLETMAALAARGCEDAGRAYTSAVEEYGTFRDELTDYLPLVASLKDSIEALDGALGEIQVGTMKSVADALGGALGPTGGLDIAGLANWAFTLWDKQIGAADLDQAFSAASANIAFVEGAVSPAIHRELGVCEGLGEPAASWEDPPMRDFAPVRNAITMSKLTLLPGAQLNKLMRDLDDAAGSGAAASAAGSPKDPATGSSASDALGDATAGQPPLLAPLPEYGSDLPVGAVLLGAVRSIDGDHQWLPTAPPMPRRDAAPTLEERQCRRFGYPQNGIYGTACPDDALDAGENFFRLTNRPGFLIARGARRDSVFAKLFRPVAPELCGFLGHQDHPALTCSTGEPFPSYDPHAEWPDPAAGAPRRGRSRPRAGSLRRSPAISRLALPARTLTLATPPFDRFEAMAEAHSWANTYLLALLSYAPYPGAVAQAPAWRDLDQALAAWGLDLLEWKSVRRRWWQRGSGSTEFLVAESPEALLVSFRGSTVTFEDLGQDWFDNDLDLRPRRKNDWGRGVVLHGGFYDAANLVLRDVEAIVREHAEGRPVWLTGHSLGGAVAFLTAFHLEAKGVDVQGVYTYGAPPVGNEAWRQAYEGLVANTQRWSAENDPVALVMTQVRGPLRHVGSRNNLLAGNRADLAAARELRYPASRGMHGLVEDLSTTHMSYWCRLHELAGRQGRLEGLPVPPNSECDLCRWPGAAVAAVP